MKGLVSSIKYVKYEITISYPSKDMAMKHLLTRITYVKYESSSPYQSKVIAKVKVFS
jgi:hypothetical protein